MKGEMTISSDRTKLAWRITCVRGGLKTKQAKEQLNKAPKNKSQNIGHRKQKSNQRFKDVLVIAKLKFKQNL